MSVTNPSGEARVEAAGQITLPVETLLSLGWAPGDTLIVQQVGQTIRLRRRPIDWVETFSGKMADVWGDHEDTLRYLDEERKSWESSPDDER